MYGAILGDIIGQPYEFGPNNIKTKDFSLFTKHPRFTDDSVMTVAVCDGVLTAGFDADEKAMKKSVAYTNRHFIISDVDKRIFGSFADIDSPAAFNKI